jgi:hypothetical protein
MTNFTKNNVDKLGYVYPDGKPEEKKIFASAYGSFFIITNLFIPLDIIILLEIAKISYSKVMEDDIEMSGINYQDREF